MTVRVAYLTGRKWRGRPMAPGALPTQEAPDHSLIVEAGEARGLAFELAYWDDPDLAARGFDCAIIRSCWDYSERSAEFVTRLETLEQDGLRVFNPAAVVRWNGRKTYLQALGEIAIPTVWLEKVTADVVSQAFDSLDASELVIKPQVGAGSRETVRLKRNGWSEADLLGAPSGAAMAQPYLRAIEDEGERSLFWFGGAYSHAVRKVPEAGAWLANRQEAARFFAEAPPETAREVAEAGRAHAPEGLLYARIDVVRDDGGHWRVIEIEAIEPYLFLAFAPAAAEGFVDALGQVLSA